MLSGRISGLVAAAAALLASGCALQAHTDYDQKTPVVGCRSYAFADQQAAGLAAAAAFDNPLNAKRLRDAIASSLAARNLTVVAAGASADCVLSYAIGSRLAPNLLASGYGWGPALGPPVGWGYYGAARGVVWAAPYDHREGRVSVNLFDARTQQALWHAYVDADVTGLTGAEADQRIQSVVAAIFEKFPQTATATPVPAPGKP